VRYAVDSFALTPVPLTRIIVRKVRRRVEAYRRRGGDAAPDSAGQ